MVNWLTENIKDKNCMLHYKYFPGFHAGINIASAFQNMLSEWDIDHRVNVIIRVSAYNIQLVLR